MLPQCGLICKENISKVSNIFRMWGPWCITENEFLFNSIHSLCDVGGSCAVSHMFRIRT